MPFGVVMLESCRTAAGGWGLGNYARMFRGWFYFEILVFTFKVSLWVTLAAFLTGYPLAYYMTRVVAKRWLRRFLYIVVVTPLFTSNIVRSFGWMILLGRRGLINETLLAGGLIDGPLPLLNNEFSIVVGLAYIMTPFMVLTVAAVLQNIDPAYESAALDLGANRLVTFAKITFPLSLPGVVAGSLIVFTLSVSAYVTPSILERRQEDGHVNAHLPAIRRRVRLPVRRGPGRRAPSDDVDARGGLPACHREAAGCRAGGAGMTLGDRIGKALLVGFCWIAVLYLTLPLLIIVAVSFTTTEYMRFPPVGFTLRWYAQFLHDPSYLEAIWESAALAVGSTAMAILLGLPAALALSRSHLPGRRTISALFLSPLVLPTIVIGAALLQFAGALGFARSWPALLIGHTILVIPYILRTTLASLTGFETVLEEAAQDLGASCPETFRFITLPLIKPGVIAGALFALIISWINVELSMFNTTASLMTIPVKLFNYIQYAIDPMIAAISAGTIYVAVVLVVLLDRIIGLDRMPAA